MQRPSYWFPAKRRGWGWGPPNSWQGWVVLAAFFALLAAGAALLLPSQRVAAFVAWSVLLAVVLAAICRIKGEPPSWR
jgi:hypothetical protein